MNIVSFETVGKRHFILLAATAILFCAGSMPALMAQSYQGLEAVKLVDVVSEDSISLDPESSGPLVVVIFTSNFCPYSRKYEDRIKELHNTYSPQEIDFLLVNPNDTPDDSVEEMQKKAQSTGYDFPYLKDHDQVLKNIMGASRTPEAYLLRPVPNGFELVYQGAIDDNPQTAQDVEFQYLKSAIDRSLNGQPPEQAKVKVTGCIIKR